MNNKLLSRIAAAAISVTMLGTFAFAADPSAEVKTESDVTYLNFVIGGADTTISDEAQITMMAYVVDKAATLAEFPVYDGTQEVVALDQTAGSTGFATVPVDPAKLADGKKLAVVLGGSDGTADKFFVEYSASEGIKIVIGDVNGDGQVTALDKAFVGSYASAANKDAFNVSVGLEIGKTVGAYVIGDVNGDGQVTALDKAFIGSYASAANKDAFNQSVSLEIGVEK